MNLFVFVSTKIAPIHFLPQFLPKKKEADTKVAPIGTIEVVV
jgi:hypothetical protein